MMNYKQERPIIELSTVIQYEGMYIGIPHILIQFSGCPLSCVFCDFSFENDHKKKNYTLEEIETYLSKNEQIKHVLITGGSPTLHPPLLQEICLLASHYKKFTTIETEGSKFVSTCADFISLSLKLSNSTPTKNSVSKEIYQRHEKLRKNYDAMYELITKHEDYQLKPRISTQENINELIKLQEKLKIPNHKIYLTVECITKEQEKKLNVIFYKMCIEEGYNFSPGFQFNFVNK